MLVCEETLSHKRRRYLIRNEISEIVRQKHIPPERFGEFSKISYKRVFARFYYSFAEHDKNTKYDSEYLRIHSVDCYNSFFGKKLRSGLEKELIARWDRDWVTYCNEMKNGIPENGGRKLFFILNEGWIYDGYAGDIINILAETSILLKDSYIVSKKFDWFIGLSDDGECAVLYRK